MAERAAGGDLACRGDPVGQRQAARDRAHPAGEDVERDVHAAEEQHRGSRRGSRRRRSPSRAGRSSRAASRSRARGDRHDDDRGERRHRVEARAGIRAAARRRTKVKVETSRPFASTGTSAAEEDRRPVRRRREQRPERPEPALVGDRHRHPVHRRHRAHLDRVPDDVEVADSAWAYSPSFVKKISWKSRRAEHGRDVDRRPDPVEQAAVGESPADEEDARTSGASCQRQGRAVAGQALEPAQRDDADDDARDALEQGDSASGNHTSPPSAACRIAWIPQYGGSTHEIGRVQAGRRAIEKSSPESDPDRVLEQVRQGVGVPVEHEGRPRAPAPSARGERIGAGTREREQPRDARNAAGRRRGASPRPASRRGRSRRRTSSRA